MMKNQLLNISLVFILLVINLSCKQNSNSDLIKKGVIIYTPEGDKFSYDGSFVDSLKSYDFYILYDDRGNKLNSFEYDDVYNIVKPLTLQCLYAKDDMVCYTDGEEKILLWKEKGQSFQCIDTLIISRMFRSYKKYHEFLPVFSRMSKIDYTFFICTIPYFYSYDKSALLIKLKRYSEDKFTVAEKKQFNFTDHEIEIDNANNFKHIYNDILINPEKAFVYDL